ncbi:hypothetical protein JB92DRAFT_3126929 [Gautieria morchelliformis]|nr:hypothetical protein JB92DRAFT_3126929 [Gautieria morchelliformis]
MFYAPEYLFSQPLTSPLAPTSRPITLDASLNLLVFLQLDHQDIHSLKTVFAITTELLRLEDADPMASSRTIKVAPYPPDLVRRDDRWVINPEFFKQARYSSGRNPSDPVPNRADYPLRHHQRAFDQLEQRNAWSIKTARKFRSKSGETARITTLPMLSSRSLFVRSKGRRTSGSRKRS